jgi:hypothetical protein
MLRRFDQFQWGPLNAQRLNELVDAIVRLQQEVRLVQARHEPTKDVILARITGPGVRAVGCERGLKVVSYPFLEVGLLIAKEGNIESETCVRTEPVSNPLSQQVGAYLLMIEDEPSLSDGDVVKAHLASRTDGGNAIDKQMVYIGTPRLARVDGNVELATIVAGGNALYDCLLNETQEPIQAYNLYETQNYYGALDASVECATLSVSQPLPAGSVIWVFRPIVDGRPASTWVTMTPVAFDSVCTCNNNDVQALDDAALNDAELQDGKGGAAAHIITRIMGV